LVTERRLRRLRRGLREPGPVRTPAGFAEECGRGAPPACGALVAGGPCLPGREALERVRPAETEAHRPEQLRGAREVRLGLVEAIGRELHLPEVEAGGDGGPPGCLGGGGGGGPLTAGR